MTKYKRLPATAKTSGWKGLTLDELQYAKVITLTRIEIEKARMIDAAEATRASLPFVGQPQTASTIFNAIGRIEYLIIAIRLFRKIAPLFRKKK